MIPDLLRIVQRWPPDVIVSGRAEIAGSTVGELLNIPYVTASAGRVIALSEFLAQIRAGREKLRADLALLPDPQGEALYRYLYLNFIPDLFLPSDQDARTVRFHMRPITFDDVGEDHAPPWLLSLPPRSLIYVTFGSNQGPLLGSVFSTVISGVRELGLSVVVTVGPAGNPDNLCRLSANVHVVRYIPQRFVLERAALVVCHGGINTVLGALSHGVPLLLIPTEQSDQLWNALRCESLGVGTKLDADGLSIESVSLAAETILGKERYQRATSSFRESLDNLLPLERGVELILRVARDGEPQFAR
jgi:UDP:flavonoid glycosyltransferase YjiC (YdhE family)